MTKSTRREFLAITAGAAAGLALGAHRRVVSAEEMAKAKLLHRIDCTQDLPAEKYFAHGDVKVVQSAAGPYREAQGAPLSRFGYRFPIQNIGKPHVAVVRYPDDKRRFMCIMDGTCYDLTTGVLTDFAQPLTGTMQESRQVFWPRWTDCSIVLTTWSHGEPAAAAEILIYELDDLTPLAVPGDPGDGSRRQIGIQYEDPCGIGASEGAQTLKEWIERVTIYAQHTGQNRFVYPVVWYHGPQYPSAREPSENGTSLVARDRTCYGRWTTHPSDWVAEMLEHFGRHGIQMHAALTLLRLGSLMQRMNIDLEAIKAGKETFNNMLANDQVQAGTHDWTPSLNAMLYADVLAGKGHGPAYGERTDGPYGPGPMFNPLHPTVQEAVVGVAEEIAQRYKRFPAFKGLSFNLWHATIIWYASLNSGYDDYTVGLFEKEMGVRVPVDAKAPDRFSKRHQLLTAAERRERWIGWRCEKIRQLLRRIRDVVVAARPDLRVTFTMWTETTVRQLLGEPNTPGHQIFARKSTVELYREGGFDVNLYRDEPGIDVDYVFLPARDRDCWGSAGVNESIEKTSMFRDHDFLDRPSLDAVASLQRPGAFVFNCWVEAWGQFKVFPCEPNDAQAKQLVAACGQATEGVLRSNAEYPKDGFWWNSQLRITPAFQGGGHFLEHYAHAVAELDALHITAGGLFLDRAHGQQIGPFARAYRALPAQKFQTVGHATDPVAVRTLVHNGRRYFYAVNRDYYPVKVDVAFGTAPKAAEDLATGEKLDLPKQWSLALGPYELRSFAVALEVEIVRFTATPPESIVRELRRETELALAAFAKLRAAGKSVLGMDDLDTRLRAALADSRVAWLRRALTSYVVRKCRALGGV
jgi:hypothetical protein